jgi:hypothetical protein
MARFSIFIVIVLIALTGCNKTKEPIAPEDVYMARHITKVHGVKIGSDERSDIIVNPSEDKVKVVFNNEFYNSLTPDAFFALRIDKKEAEFTKKGYVSFLGKFHAYLMMTPGYKKDKTKK